MTKSESKGEMPVVFAQCTNVGGFVYLQKITTSELLLVNNLKLSIQTKPTNQILNVFI